MAAFRLHVAAPAAFAALALGACASEPMFQTEAKPGTSPADLPTYAWYDHVRPDDGVSDLLGTDFEPVLKSAGDAALVAKGYRADGRPAMLVNWHLVVHELVDTQKMAEFYGYGPGWSTWAARSYPSAARPVSSERADDGTIVIDVLRADTKELIWRGYCTAEIDEEFTIPQRRGRVAAAVSQVISQLPPAR